MAAPPAPLPPEVAEQQSPEGAQSAFMAEGLPAQQPGMTGVQMAMQKISELEDWLRDMMNILRQLNPGSMATLAPIAQAAKVCRDQIIQVAKKSGMAQGSPQVGPPPQGNPGAAPPNPVGQ